MFTLYRAALAVHIVAGMVGMAAFWTPVLTRKGGTTHRRAGRVFFRATSIVAVTGLVMAAALFSAPLAAQLPRQEPSRLRAPFHTAINVTTILGSIGMIAIGLAVRQPIFVFMSPIGFLVGIGNLRFARRPWATPMAWWYEHMGSMLGGGIAFHTAFLVLGAGRLLGLQLEGMASVVPWVLPSVVGIPASAIWTRSYRRKFGDLEQRRSAAA